MKSVAGVYVYGGITLVSEIELPELPLVQQQDSPEHPVNIRVGDPPSHSPEAVEIDPDCFATRDQYWLRIPGIGSYLVTNGKEVLVSPEPGALALDVRAYLLGTLFVALCQQRRLLPLHASAVSTGNGVIAFLARSGEGKSSLAACLAERGFRILADDVCLVNTLSDGPVMVAPTAPWLKLWRTSLERLGRRIDGLERVFSEDDKYRVPLIHSSQAEPLVRVVFLEKHDATEPWIQELTAVEAIPRLMDLTHQSYVLQATGQLQESFMRCSRVSSQAKAYRLLRPWGLEHLKTTVDAVEKALLRN